jgi:NADPH-dependent curcumin reductase CurA
MISPGIGDLQSNPCKKFAHACGVQVLKAEYRRGIDVIYESVGGDMFKVAIDALADKGCLLIIGMMSQYGEGWPLSAHPGLPEKLLKKSATLKGALWPEVALPGRMYSSGLQSCNHVSYGAKHH